MDRRGKGVCASRQQQRQVNSNRSRLGPISRIISTYLYCKSCSPSDKRGVRRKKSIAISWLVID